MNLKKQMFEFLLNYVVNNDLDPHILVVADRVGLDDLHNVENTILLNISGRAVRNFVISDDGISFSATFSGVQRTVEVLWENLLTVNGTSNKEVKFVFVFKMFLDTTVFLKLPEKAEITEITEIKGKRYKHLTVIK